MEGRVYWKGSAERIAEHAGRWRQAGVTHLGVNTMGAGLVGLDAHLDALERAAGVLFG